MNALEESTFLMLNSILIRLEKSHIYEASFTQFYGRDYLDTFDEHTSNIEDFVIGFCKRKKIHLVKTRISYIFSYQPISFKRKSDQELA